MNRFENEPLPSMRHGNGPEGPERRPESHIRSCQMSDELWLPSIQSPCHAGVETDVAISCEGHDGHEGANSGFHSIPNCTGAIQPA